MIIKDTAKTIVCYGDSNTWGRVPHGERYPRSVRWPNVLQKLLGDDYEVISEGLPGRTFVAVNPDKPYRTGITHLEAIINSHAPIDVMVIMLGTNDVKTTYGLSPEDIAGHLEQTIQLIQKDVQKVLVICPPEIITPEDSELNPKFLPGLEISKKLPPLFKAVAEKCGCGFVNAQDHISSSKADGFHFEAADHAKLANAVKDELLKMSI